MSIEEAIKRVERVAKGAWYGVSFSPEKRAATFVKEFEQELRKYAAEVEKVDSEKVEEFVKRYTDKAVNYVSTQSRKMSTMITGPANFPTRSQQKIGDTLHKRLGEYVDYPEYYLERLKKRKRKQWEKETGYNTPAAELERQKAYLAKLKDNHEKMKEANRIIRSGKNVQERLSKIQFEGAGIKSWWKKDLAEGKGFQTWALSNNLANIKRVEQRVIELERKAAAVGREEPKLPIENGYIIKNREEDRLQIMFDDVPDANIRTALKKNGYRWSPKQKAWQRKLTSNALYSLSRLYEVLGVKKEDVSAYNAKVKALEQPKEAEKPKEISQEDQKVIDEVVSNLNKSDKNKIAVDRQIQSEVMAAYRSEKPPMQIVHSEPTGKPSSDKDYIQWLASVTRLFEQAFRMDTNEVQKLLKKHDSIVSKAWAKGLDSLDAGKYIATEMDEAEKLERQEAAKSRLNLEKEQNDAVLVDFIFEVSYGGGYTIKTFHKLPTSRSVKLDFESDSVPGLLYYKATDKGLADLKKSGFTHAYGDKQRLGAKNLTLVSDKPKAAPKPTPKKKAKPATKKKTGKSYLTDIMIEFNEGTVDFSGKHFDSAASFMAALLKIGVPDVGYNKVKFHATFDDGTKIVDRIDLGASGGDYNPFNESITTYMDRQKGGVMYESTRDQNDIDAGKYTFRFADDKEDQQQKYEVDVKFTVYPKDKMYDAVTASVTTDKVYGNRYRITWRAYRRGGNVQIDVTKIDNNPFGGVVGKEFETFADAQKAYKSNVIKDAIAELKKYVDANYEKLVSEFKSKANKPTPDTEKLKLLKMKAKALKLKYKY
jgi:hypothetical protein